MLEKNLLNSEIKFWLSNMVQHYSAGGIKADFNPAPKKCQRKTFWSKYFKAIYTYIA